jgi:hypothetical protein
VTMCGLQDCNGWHRPRWHRPTGLITTSSCRHAIEAKKLFSRRPIPAPAARRSLSDLRLLDRYSIGVYRLGMITVAETGPFQRKSGGRARGYLEE